MVYVTRAFVLVCMSLSALYLFRFAKAEEKVLYPSTCSCVIDSVFSKNLNQNITLFVSEKYDQKSSIQSLTESIKDQFPMVKSISASIDNADVMKFIIRGDKPVVLVNSDLVVTRDGSICDRSMFSSTSIKSLRGFACAQSALEKGIKKRSLEFFKRVPDPFFDAYQVQWDSHDSIWLHDKQKPVSLLVASNWDMNTDDLHLGRQLCEQAIAERSKKKRRKRKVKWVCDLRFQGQVVTYPAFE